MSERIVSDPSQHGWVEVDGKWMWGASGGSGGSIQDGDTEGQITTWDGTEWTPEGAVVVTADGNVGIGTDTPLYTSAGRQAVTVNGDSSANLVFGHSGAPAHYLLSDASGLTIGDASGGNVTIDENGNVGIGSAPLALSGTRTCVDGQGAGGGIEIHSGGTRQAQMYSAADGTVNIGSLTDQPLNIIAGGGTRITVDKNGRVDITGSLFVNGQEVTAGGGGGGGFWVEETPGVIKYNGTAKATDLVAG